MLEELQTIFDSTIKALDVLYVLEDIKPVSRIMLKEENYQPTIKFLEQINLFQEISNFKVEKTDNTDYSDKGVKLPLTSEKKGSYFLYISKNKELTEKAKNFEEKGEHYSLGIILGYPECCSRFFHENFPMESKKNNDYVFPALKNSNGFRFPFHTNIIARHLDLNLISHFPCNFNCKASITIANKNLECIKKHSAEISKVIEGMLKGAVIYTQKRELFLLRNFNIEKNKLFYNNIISNTNNELAVKLKQNKAIEIINKNSIKIGNEELKDIGFMVFE